MTYEEGGQDLILPGQVSDAVARRQGLHGVQQRQEARRLHREPADAAGHVEAADDGRLTHAIPRDEPLQGGKLFRPTCMRHLSAPLHSSRLGPAVWRSLSGIASPYPQP